VPRAILSARAREDLKEIGRYTEEQWGRAQRRTYLRALFRRFRALVGRPQSGTSRAILRKGYLSIRHGSHAIFYRKRNGDIEIVRVLHAAMDIERHLNEER